MFRFSTLRLPRTIILALCVMSAVLFPAPSASAVQGGALRIGVENDYPPFSFPDENGRQSGFDPAVAEALCRAMERPCEILPLPFEELLNAMREGKLDLIIAGLGANGERRAYMDFSESYYHSRTIYIGRPGHPDKPGLDEGQTAWRADRHAAGRHCRKAVEGHGGNRPVPELRRDAGRPVRGQTRSRPFRRTAGL